MKTAKELADAQCHIYQLLKCQVWAEDGPVREAPPILEVYYEGEVAPEVCTLMEPWALARLVVVLEHQQEREITACVFNVEVYNVRHEWNKSPLAIPVGVDDPTMERGLVTIAATRNGDSHVKLYQYYGIDNGGLEFEQQPIQPERMALIIQMLTSMWADPITKKG